MGTYLWKNRMFYLLLLPGILYYIVFRFIPLSGIVIAFQRFSILKGVWRSPWVGFDNFAYIFSLPEFHQALGNSIILNLYSLVFGFPFPIILALLLNELRNPLFKRVTQTLIYIPHFLSWVIIGGIFISILSPGYGAVNNMIRALGGEPIYFAADPRYIRTLIVGSGIWRGAGWGTIVYLAALTTVDPQLYEAAVIDGAGRWKQTLHVTIPAIIPTATVLFLLKVGDLMQYGFEHVYVFLNAAVESRADIIETYVYRSGIEGGQYSLATAVGLFQMVIGIILISLSNALVKARDGHSLF